MYLPIAPEIEDPEDNWVPGIDPMPSSEDSPHKRGSSEAFKDNSTKKKPKTIDVVLENAPTDEVHPMMSKSSSVSGGANNVNSSFNDVDFPPASSSRARSNQVSGDYQQPSITGRSLKTLTKSFLTFLTISYRSTALL